MERLTDFTLSWCLQRRAGGSKDTRALSRDTSEENQASARRVSWDRAVGTLAHWRFIGKSRQAVELASFKAKAVRTEEDAIVDFKTQGFAGRLSDGRSRQQALDKTTYREYPFHMAAGHLRVLLICYFVLHALDGRACPDSKVPLPFEKRTGFHAIKDCLRATSSSQTLIETANL